MTSAERFYDYLKDKRIAFIGTGVSHDALITGWTARGFDITLCDRKTSEQLSDTYSRYKDMGVKFCLGEAYLDSLTDYDVVFRTPGMYFFNEKLTAARAAGVVVTSEMEVFFDLCPCRIYAITGTEGKTTTTTLISEFLTKSGVKVWKGGNIGRALLPQIDNIGENDAAVVELSSFQLISMRRSPDVAAFTNVYPDHLNVHSSMDEYVGAKKNLILHQNAFSRTVLNMDNDITRSFAPLVRGDLYMFSRLDIPERGTYLDADGWLCFTDKGISERIVHKDDIRIPGMHNVEDYLAAIAVVHGSVSTQAVVDTAKTFAGVEHRIEFVRELKGVKYYNDSIATSPVCVIAGLNAFDRRLIVIAGGSDKNLDYTALAQPINERVKTLVLLGATADKIEKAVRGYKDYNEENCRIIRVGSMEEAVTAAKECAVSGDIVTLSPASASFDMFKNFEDRGRCFKEIVNGLEE